MKLGAIIVSIIVAIFVVAILVGHAFAHDSWISKGGYRSPPGASNAGEWCCGEGDCGVMVPNTGKITAAVDGYHVDVDFVIGSGEGAIQYHVKEVVPYADSQPSPDGSYWRCKAPNGNRRCFFAPPPNT